MISQQYLPGMEETGMQLSLYELQKTIENTRRGLFKRYTELEKELREIKHLMQEKDKMIQEVNRIKVDICNA